MSRILSALLLTLFFALPAQAANVQFFPPQGPCNAEYPILAWNGSGSTYCTRFPTAALPDCGDGEFLTKKNGNLVCEHLTTGAVSSSTPATPSAPTTTEPTPVSNSNGTPTGATTYPNPVQRTGNNACPDITIPTCASDSVLVNYGLDYNGCQTSPQCKYMGSTEAAQAAKASYANGGLSNNGVASTNGTGAPSVANGGISHTGTASTNGTGVPSVANGGISHTGTASTNGNGTPSYANGGISNNSVASGNGYGYGGSYYYNPYSSGSYYSTPYYTDPYYSTGYYYDPNDYVESGYSYND